MKWFSGKVDIAIQVSSRNKALFIIFIDSEDEKGAAMNNMWDEIDASIFTCNHIAVKIKDELDVAKIASMISQPVNFDAPTSIFISSAGEVLETFSETDVEKLKNLIPEIIKKSAPEKIASEVIPVIATPVPSTSNATVESSNPEPQPQSSPVLSRAEQEQIMQEKLKKARVLLEQSKKDDAEEKREAEERKEGKRLKARLIAERERKEQEIRDATYQRKRNDKQIEQDKLRVRAQFLADREDKDFRELTRTGKFTSENVRRKDPYVAPPVGNGRCRILVRFTDGKTLTDNFEATSPFRAVVDSINESGFIFKPYTLVRPYPRTNFVESDYTKSFNDLELAPSCVLYVQEESDKSNGGIGSKISSIFSMVLSAPWNALSAIYGMFFGRPQTTLRYPGSPLMTPERERSLLDRERERSNRVAGLNRSDGTESSDSDENANWNGNSTQFL